MIIQTSCSKTNLASLHKSQQLTRYADDTLTFLPKSTFLFKTESHLVKLTLKCKKRLFQFTWNDEQMLVMRNDWRFLFLFFSHLSVSINDPIYHLNTFKIVFYLRGSMINLVPRPKTIFAVFVFTQHEATWHKLSGLSDLSRLHLERKIIYHARATPMITLKRENLS